MPRDPHRLLICSMTVPWPGRPTQGLYHVDQAKALTRSGVHTTIFSPAPWVPRFARHLNGRLGRHAARPESYEVDGVPIVSPRTAYAFTKTARTRAARWCPSLVERHASLALADPLMKAIRTHRINGLLVHGCLPWGRLVRDIAKQADLPYAVIEHSASDVLRLRSGSATSCVYSKTADDAKAVFTVNHAMTNHLRDHIDCPRVVHLPNGVTPLNATQQSLPRPRDLDDALLLVSAGQYYRRKGFEELIESFALIARRYPSAVLILVTEPNASLKNRITRLGLTGRIRITGLLPRTEVLQWMVWADLFVLPSWGESFGMVYLEAMSCGTPVVMCTDCGLSRELRTAHGGLGWTVEPRDVAGLSRRLADVLRDPARLARIGEMAKQQIASRYSWERNAATVARWLWD